jgi:shikimate dehydrogenase|tara:strand:+ start:167 stop:943 length:777 start_codon:yes stop_codon:yes gene_type:complete
MAINPGNSGASLHNSLFKVFKFNNIYLPLKVKNIIQAKKILTNFNFKGCSLSMPFKEKLINFVDKLDVNAKKIGSINTVLKKNNKLIGYNTDYYASKEILKKQRFSKKANILVLGSGGAAKAVLQSIIDLKFTNIFLSSRNKSRFNKMKIKKKITFIKWNKRNKINCEILINTTPLGMFGQHEKKIPIEFSKKNFPKLIYDLPINHSGNLLSKFANKNKIKYISGLVSSYNQGLKQFEIYNNVKVNLRILKKINIKLN